jgi:hypothetical protein
MGEGLELEALVEIHVYTDISFIILLYRTFANECVGVSKCKLNHIYIGYGN